MNKNIRVIRLADLSSGIFEHQPAQVITLIDPNPKHNDQLAHINHISENVQRFEHLSLRFADEDDANDPDGPKWDHIEKILEFAKPDADIICTCNGGISRSSATAIGLLAARGFTPHQACEIAWINKPNIWPNKLMLSMFDRKFKLDGQLVQAAMLAKLIPRCMMCGAKVEKGENSCGCW